MQPPSVLAQFGQGGGERRATLWMPLVAGDMDFSVGGFHVHEINRVRCDDRDIDLEPLAVVAAQFKVVEYSVIGRQTVTEIRDGFPFRVVRWLADGGDLRH